MTLKLGINGFGRIGRMVLRAAIRNFSDIEIVGINDLMAPDHLAYLLKYDSVHGRFQGTVAVEGDTLVVNGRSIHLSAIADPGRLKWHEIGVDVVIESTGFFLDQAGAGRHLAAGAKKVIMSAPAVDDTPMFVFGVNDQDYAGQAVISNASCTTNCLAPVAKVLHDTWGIRRGLMSTIHPATIGQRVVDGPSPSAWRSGRGMLENLIPCATRSASALGAVIPALAGKLDGISFRVPSADVSVMDLTVELARPAALDEICTAMEAAAAGALAGVLGYVEEVVVAADLRGDSCSAIFDAAASVALDETFFKLVAWYDNEWGYANKLLEMARRIAG